MMNGGVVPGGICAEHGLRDGRHLRRRRLDVGARLEEDLDDRDARERLALDVLDVVDGGGERALVVGDDALLHLLGRQARVVPDDRDDRDVDVREDVGRHPEDGDDAQDDDEHRHHDERVGAPQRQADDPHGAIRPRLESREAWGQTVVEGLRAGNAGGRERTPRKCPESGAVSDNGAWGPKPGAARPAGDLAYGTSSVTPASLRATSINTHGAKRCSAMGGDASASSSVGATGGAGVCVDAKRRGLTRSISAQNGRLSRQRRPLSGQRSAPTVVNGARTTVNGALMTVNRALTAVNRALTAVNRVFKTVSRVFKTVSRAFKTLSSAFKTLNSAFKTLNRVLTALNRALTALNRALTALNRALTALNRPLTMLNRPLTAVNRLLTMPNASLETVSVPFTNVKRVAYDAKRTAYDRKHTVYGARRCVYGPGAPFTRVSAPSEQKARARYCVTVTTMCADGAVS